MITISCGQSWRQTLLLKITLSIRSGSLSSTLLMFRFYLYPGCHRYDWSPHESELDVRMLISTHDIFTELVVEEIKSQLNSAQQTKNCNVSAVLSHVRSETTSDVYLYGLGAVNGKYSKRSPDALIAHADSQYPSIIIETSYS
jgi:hypothetical protein